MIYDVVLSESGSQWFLVKSGILKIAGKDKTYYCIVKVYYNKCKAVKEMRRLQGRRE